MKKPTARDLRLLTLYGITEAERKIIFDVQGGKCFICRQPLRLNIDHDHKSGVTRGLVCFLCNKGLALFRDDHLRFGRALIYLYNNPARNALEFSPIGRVGRSTRKWRTKREKRERMAWVVGRLRELGYEVPRRLRKFVP